MTGLVCVPKKNYNLKYSYDIESANFSCYKAQAVYADSFDKVNCWGALSRGSISHVTNNVGGYCFGSLKHATILNTTNVIMS